MILEVNPEMYLRMPITKAILPAREGEGEDILQFEDAVQIQRSKQVAVAALQARLALQGIPESRRSPLLILPRGATSIKEIPERESCSLLLSIASFSETLHPQVPYTQLAHQTNSISSP